MGSLALPGVVTGLPVEAALIRKSLAGNRAQSAAICCHGPGPTAAERAALELIDRGIGGLVSFGLAGGIDETIAAGTIVLATEVRDGRRDQVDTTAVWRAAVLQAVKTRVETVEAPMAAVEAIVGEAGDKTRLRYESGGVAADMESLAIGRAAMAAGLPFIVIRAVSDPALQSLPVMALEAVDQAGKLRAWRIAWSLIRHPGQLAELRRLAANTRAATKALATVCKQVGPQFCLPDIRGGLIRQLRAAGDPA